MGGTTNCAASPNMRRWWHTARSDSIITIITPRPRSSASGFANNFSWHENSACPYLTPFSHRDKRNEPAFVSHVAKHLADIHSDLSLAQIEQVTTNNAQRLFSKIRERTA